MSVWIKGLSIGMITLVLGFLLRELGFRGYRLAVILGTVGVIGIATSSISEIISTFSVFGQDYSAEHIKTILKIIGIGCVSGICADICVDLGEVGLSNAILLIGKCEIVVLAAPCAISVVQKGVELI